MRTWIFFVTALPLASFAACTATNSSFDDDAGEVGGSGAASNQGGSATTGIGGGAITVGVGVGGSTGSGAPCNTDPALDDDGDGFSEDQGDCNDCDSNVNADAVEVIGDPMDGSGGSGGYVPADEDCDMQADEPPTGCDQGLMLADTNPMSGAKAIDLCQEAGNGQGWGVVSAGYVRANGTAFANPGLTVGISGTADPLGANVSPQGGSSYLVMSSGHARGASQSGACGALYCPTHGSGTAPPNFPQDVPSCPGASDIHDDIALELQVKAPSNATGYSFDFAFMSFEYPEWVCTSYNDQFIALVSPPPMGSINGNISFDASANPVSVNIALFDHCTGCPAGPAFMQGTGYNEWNDAGATGWLVTTAPIGAGETFSIRYAIWDTGDQSFDSAVAIDNFRWTAEPGTVVGTDPVPDPR